MKYKGKSVLTTVLWLMTQPSEFRRCNLQTSRRMGASHAGRNLTLAVLPILPSKFIARRMKKREHTVCYCDLTAMYTGLPFFASRLKKIQRSQLTLRLIMSYIYIAPSKSRIANVVYIWTYVWQRWNSLLLFAHNVSTLNQCREVLPWGRLR